MINPPQGGYISVETAFSLSADGSIVAFDSDDESLVANDHNGTYDVFAAALPSRAIELVSSHSPTLTCFAPNGLNSMSERSVSANGRRIAFSSTGTDLVANDTNWCSDVFVRDLDLGTNILASVAMDGSSANGPSFDPAISADGRYVAFTSRATNLVAGDTNRHLGVFLRDLQSGSTKMISPLANSGDSSSPQISDDGSVLYVSQSSSWMGLYFYDLQTQQTHAVLTNYSGSALMTPNAHYILYTVSGGFYIWDRTSASIIYTNSQFSYPPSSQIGSPIAFSPDGRWIVAQNGTNLVLFDLTTKTYNTAGSTTGSCPPPKFSGNEMRFVYVSQASTVLRDKNIYYYDLGSKTSVLVSHAAGLTTIGGGASDLPQISPDGRFIAYRSTATNIAGVHTNGLPVIVLYDSQTGSNLLVSANPVGAVNDRALNPVFSGDGQSLVFLSWNTGLSPQSYGFASEVFEYPIFHLSVATRVTADGVWISWPTVAGMSYRADYSEDLTTPNWQPVAGTIVNQGDTGSILDTASTAARRFYRAVQWKDN
jgi:Tol biopolymer transport system component